MDCSYPWYHWPRLFKHKHDHLSTLLGFLKVGTQSLEQHKRPNAIAMLRYGLNWNNNIYMTLQATQ